MVCSEKIQVRALQNYNPQNHLLDEVSISSSKQVFLTGVDLLLLRPFCAVKFLVLYVEQ